MDPIIPVVLFAYARPNHLRRTVACLRENNVPLIYAYSDGAKTPDAAERVSEVRQILREIDWCEVHLVERTENLGLGKSILTGVAEVFQKHEAIIVFEEDLICASGTYQYMRAALEHYKDDRRVMSVTGFTHPLTTPGGLNDQPYFDGRADCWVWGAWARSWIGMENTALEIMNMCDENHIETLMYGGSLPEMAKVELKLNIWAVRFFYLHFLKQGLCLRPPYSMVEHIGFDNFGTNAKADPWNCPPIERIPQIPENWPEPIEHPDCLKLWQVSDPVKTTNSDQFNIPTNNIKIIGKIKSVIKKFVHFK